MKTNRPSRTDEIIEPYTNIDIKHLQKLGKLSKSQLSIYLYICSKQTFAYKTFGIFKRESFSTLRNGTNKFMGEEVLKEVKDAKRACEQLEKKGLLAILNKIDSLIISTNTENTLFSITVAIKNNTKAFNLFLPRIRELSSILELDYSYFVNLFSEQKNKELKNSQEKQYSFDKSYDGFKENEKIIWDSDSLPI